jgi:hypothetical protein
MTDEWKTILWHQLGATIDMLENAMHACPDHLWSKPGDLGRIRTTGSVHAGRIRPRRSPAGAAVYKG